MLSPYVLVISNLTAMKSANKSASTPITYTLFNESNASTSIQSSSTADLVTSTTQGEQILKDSKVCV